jgi:hypothetical protein
LAVAAPAGAAQGPQGTDSQGQLRHMVTVHSQLLEAQVGNPWLCACSLLWCAPAAGPAGPAPAAAGRLAAPGDRRMAGRARDQLFVPPVPQPSSRSLIQRPRAVACLPLGQSDHLMCMQHPGSMQHSGISHRPRRAVAAAATAAGHLQQAAHWLQIGRSVGPGGPLHSIASRVTGHPTQHVCGSGCSHWQSLICRGGREPICATSAGRGVLVA